MLGIGRENIPLSSAEIMTIRSNLGNYEYDVLTKPEKTILAVRVDRPVPDMMEDLERIYHQLDTRDTFDITHVCLVGNEDVISVKPDIIKALVNRRTEDDNVLIAELREKLDREFGTITFKDERDPYEVQRFAVRVPSETVTSEASYLHKVFSKANIPQDNDIYYFIGDSNFVRLPRHGARIFFVGKSEPIGFQKDDDVMKVDDTVERPGFAPPEIDRNQVKPIHQPPVQKTDFAAHYFGSSDLPDKTEPIIPDGNDPSIESDFEIFLKDWRGRRKGEILEPGFGRKTVSKPESETVPEIEKPIEPPDFSFDREEPETERETVTKEPWSEPEKPIEPPDFSFDREEPETETETETKEPWSEPEKPIEPPDFSFDREEPETEPETETETETKEPWSEPEKPIEPPDFSFDREELEKEPDTGTETETKEPWSEPEKPIEPPDFSFDREEPETEPETVTETETKEPWSEPEKPIEPPDFSFDREEPETVSKELDLPELSEPEEPDLDLDLPLDKPLKEMNHEADDLDLIMKSEPESEDRVESKPEPDTEDIFSDIKPDVDDGERDLISESIKALVKKVKGDVSEDSSTDFDLHQPSEQDISLPDADVEEEKKPGPGMKLLAPKMKVKLATKLPVIKKPEWEPEPDSISEDETKGFWESEKTRDDMDLPQPLEDTSSLTDNILDDIPEDEPVLDKPDEDKLSITEPEITEQDLKTMIPEPEIQPAPTSVPAPEDEFQSVVREVDEPPLERIASALENVNFKIGFDTSVEGVDIIASSEEGNYKRIFIKFVEECTIDIISEMEKIVDFSHADAGVVIGRSVPELIGAFTLPPKLRVFTLNDFIKECETKQFLTS